MAINKEKIPQNSNLRDWWEIKGNASNSKYASKRKSREERVGDGLIGNSTHYLLGLLGYARPPISSTNP